MKKILVITILILSPLICNSQTTENWQIGLDASPFHFGRSNPTARYEKANQSFPNGVAFGVTIEKNWNASWGLKSGLEYSFQNRKDVLKNNHRSTLEMDFEYLKLPVTLQYSRLLSSERSLYLILNQGIQVSLLTDYKLVFWDDSSGHIISTPTRTDHYNKDSDLVYSSRNETWDFEKITFGIVGSIGIKKLLNEHISLTTSLGYELDLTDADNGSIIWTDHTEDWEPKPSYNYRFRLSLGIQYHLNNDSNK